ncbi:hydrogenase maturation protease [Devriesea agamarum]|uniref:hydrogenase maturation protease n=1 Tax=Devriesea agamarum TaxID=472569 RepID=UPI000A028F18|nr:hydrogenase maturation protease [Devriesea agamarum]
MAVARDHGPTISTRDPSQVQPWHLLSDDSPPSYRVLVIGCGNVLRGDDAAGPVLVRRLWDRDLDIVRTGQVRILDAGTSGMDVAFAMRGVRDVIIVDAARTGADPGTLMEVPGEVLEQLPPAGGIHSHQFRWDHALGFGRWLLGPYFPRQVSVFLIEASCCDPGGVLSPAVDAAVDRLAAALIPRLEALAMASEHDSATAVTADG